MTADRAVVAAAVVVIVLRVTVVDWMLQLLVALVLVVAVVGRQTPWPTRFGPRIEEMA